MEGLTRIISIVSFLLCYQQTNHIFTLEMESRGNYYSAERRNRVRSKGEVKTESVSVCERGETSRPRICLLRFLQARRAIQEFRIRMCTQRRGKPRHYRKCIQIIITKCPIKSARECFPSDRNCQKWNQDEYRVKYYGSPHVNLLRVFLKKLSLSLHPRFILENFFSP